MYDDNVILANLVDVLIEDVEAQRETINTLMYEIAWLKRMVNELRGVNP